MSVMDADQPRAFAPLPRIAEHRVAVADVGEHRLFLVSPPAGTGPGTTVLYLLDGNVAVPALRPEWLAGRPQLAIVGLGYPVEAGFDVERRSRDYTPPPPADWDGGSRNALRRPHGGAGDFLDLLETRLVAGAEALLGVDPARRVLWGHSYGGLFGLFALWRGIGGFEAIHAASPSLWWGDGMMERALADFDPAAGQVRRLDLSMGDSEVSSTGEVLSGPDRLQRLAAGLRRRPGLDCSVSIFAGTGHRQAFDLSLERLVATA